MYKHVSHFPRLTPLRFVAAALVVVFHAEESRKLFRLPNLSEWSFFQNGPLAVTFFFVLSGFLITWLLLKESDISGTINIKRFYARRVLRIWPLYFLLVFIGLVLIPLAVSKGDVDYQSPYKSNEVVLFYALFAPFLVNLIYGNHVLTPLWSIGVEELFYTSWAPLFKFLRRHLLAILLGVIVTKTIATVIVTHIFPDTFWQQLCRMLQFEAMSIGGLASFCLFHRRAPIANSVLFSRRTQLILLSPLFAMIFAHQWCIAVVPGYSWIFDQPVLTPLVMMTLFAWFIVNISMNPKCLLDFGERSIIGRTLDYLGDISYGIYMFHVLFISAVITPLVDEHLEWGLVGSTMLLYGTDQSPR